LEHVLYNGGKRVVSDKGKKRREGENVIDIRKAMYIYGIRDVIILLLHQRIKQQEQSVRAAFHNGDGMVSLGLLENHFLYREFLSVSGPLAPPPKA
jgi:hypothetical protein